MTADEACRAAADGFRSACPDVEVLELPLSDGGEGLVDCFCHALPLQKRTVTVHGPLMQPVESTYAVTTDGRTAYMEIASACGLTLVPESRRNPMQTTSFGVGEMLLHIQEQGCEHIVMGLGGSATCDAGRGMLQALEGHLPLQMQISVACDVRNPLYGETGAAFVFAPQKGASPEQVLLLDERLREFAGQTEARGVATPDIAFLPGAGAAGGLGYALVAYLGAQLLPGIELVLTTIQFDKHIEGASLIVTGEGRSDAQTLMGKVPSGVLACGKAHGIPVALLSGAISEPERLCSFDYVASINEGDSRPLPMLMQRDVARENMHRTCMKLSLD